MDERFGYVIVVDGMAVLLEQQLADAVIAAAEVGAGASELVIEERLPTRGCRAWAFDFSRRNWVEQTQRAAA